MEQPEGRMPYPIDAIGVINNQIAEVHELYDDLESKLLPILNLKQDVDVISQEVETSIQGARSPLMEGLESTQSNLRHWLQS